MAAYIVTGYSDGLWCIVEPGKRRVDYHDAVGWNTIFKSREAGDAAVVKMEKHDAKEKQEAERLAEVRRTDAQASAGFQGGNRRPD
jgi:hypothetical protein